MDLDIAVPHFTLVCRGYSIHHTPIRFHHHVGTRKMFAPRENIPCLSPPLKHNVYFVVSSRELEALVLSRGTIGRLIYTLLLAPSYMDQ